jgi:hypothetical protein
MAHSTADKADSWRDRDRPSVSLFLGRYSQAQTNRAIDSDGTSTCWKAVSAPRGQDISMEIKKESQKLARHNRKHGTFNKKYKSSI